MDQNRVVWARVTQARVTSACNLQVNIPSLVFRLT
jgi:hypothetical protein